MIRHGIGAAPAVALALLAATTAGTAQAATAYAPALTAWVFHQTNGATNGDAWWRMARCKVRGLSRRGARS